MVFLLDRDSRDRVSREVNVGRILTILACLVFGGERAMQGCSGSAG